MPLNKSEQKTLDRITSDIERLANARVQRLAREWAKSRKSSLSIQFGMGSELIKVRGKHEWDHDRLPLMVREAIDDVCEITRNYCLACPGDLEIPVR